MPPESRPRSPSAGQQGFRPNASARFDPDGVVTAWPKPHDRRGRWGGRLGRQASTGGGASRRRRSRAAPAGAARQPATSRLTAAEGTFAQQLLDGCPPRFDASRARTQPVLTEPLRRHSPRGSSGAAADRGSRVAGAGGLRRGAGSSRGNTPAPNSRRTFRRFLRPLVGVRDEPWRLAAHGL